MPDRLHRQQFHFFCLKNLTYYNLHAYLTMNHSMKQFFFLKIFKQHHAVSSSDGQSKIGQKKD